MSVAMHLLGRAAKGVAKKAREQLDPDRWLSLGMSGVIEAARARHELEPAEPWAPGRPLRLLLAGYVGTRNTGADVRVEEMIRQFRHLFGDDHVELSVCTLEPKRTRGYFRTARQLHMPELFHKFLYDQVHGHDGVIACEGSMFKSKFANALSTMMAGALGLASAEQKLAVGYGGEAGRMDASLARLVERHCGDALILTRNTESQDVLRRLGVDSRLGTDTAWTYEVREPERARRVLGQQGWDQRTPLLILCPVNPYWWPVRPDPWKAAVHRLSGSHEASHYKSIYFHHDGPDVDAAFERYLSSMASAVQAFLKERSYYPVLLGMERLDREAVERLDEKLGGIPKLFSDQHDMDTMVGVLRTAGMVLSSRYHALVCSMPALVGSVGVTIDERIRNLMKERGQPDLAIDVDDEDLEARVLAALRRVDRERPAVEAGIAKAVVQNLARMGQMGIDLTREVRKYHPAFPLPLVDAAGPDPWRYLPPAGPTIQALLARYA